MLVLIRSVAVTAALAMAMAGCSSDNGDRKERSTTTGDAPVTTAATSLATAAEVNLQGREVLSLVRCPYSGPIESYITGTEKIKGSSSDSIAQTWARLKEAGATEATIHVYAGSQASCQSWITEGTPGSEPDPSLREPVASSLVVKFKDNLAAQATYAADIFGQSQLNRLQGTISGTDTGLGPNSITGGEEFPDGSSMYQAVWRKGSFIVLLRGRSLPRPDFTAAAAAQDTRIR